MHARCRSRTVLARFAVASGKLLSNQEGAVVVLAGLLLPVLVGALALGFEVSNWYFTTRDMLNAADSAAIAAASNASSNYDVEAKAVAARYGFVNGTSNVTVTASNAAACPGGAGTSCFSVTISKPVPLYLSRAVGYSGDTTVNGSRGKLLTSTSVAEHATILQPICLLALSQIGTALRTDGAPKSDFSGCSTMSNSAATCNGSNLNANFGLAAGTNSGCGNTQYSNVPVVSDPYASMASNIPSTITGPKGSCGNSYPQESTKKGAAQWTQWSGTKSLSGTASVSGNTLVCGDLQLSGDVVINTADNLTGSTLYIANGQLDLNGHTFSTADGSALTIVFTGDSGGTYTHAPTDNSAGQGGVLNVQAPSASSASFPGMAIYQDPSLKSGVDVTYKGNNPTWQISGGVYLPNSDVQVSGDVSAFRKQDGQNGADCFVMVANTILVNGTSNIYQQSPYGAGCKDAGLNMPAASIPGRGKLVY
jgi:Flp pilus assembly protein TadG